MENGKNREIYLWVYIPHLATGFTFFFFKVYFVTFDNLSLFNRCDDMGTDNSNV